MKKVATKPRIGLTLLVATIGYLVILGGVANNTFSNIGQWTNHIIFPLIVTPNNNVRGIYDGEDNANISTDLAYTENAVWIADQPTGTYMTAHPNVLTNELDSLCSTLATNHIKYAMILVGYFQAPSGTVTGIYYKHTDAFYANVINKLHQSGILAIAYVAATDYYGKVDLASTSNRQTMYGLVSALMDKGWDGYNDDVEDFFTGSNQNRIDYLNGYTPILHAKGKLVSCCLGNDNNQNTNNKIFMDHITIMFYGTSVNMEQWLVYYKLVSLPWYLNYYIPFSISQINSDTSRLENPSIATICFQKTFGQYAGHNTPPGSPIILGLINSYNLPSSNTHPLSWQLDQLEAIMDSNPHPGLVGFSWYVYEYNGAFVSTDWADWRAWIETVN